MDAITKKGEEDEEVLQKLPSLIYTFFPAWTNFIYNKNNCCLTLQLHFTTNIQPLDFKGLGRPREASLTETPVWSLEIELVYVDIRRYGDHTMVHFCPDAQLRV